MILRIVEFFSKSVHLIFLTFGLEQSKYNSSKENESAGGERSSSSIGRSKTSGESRSVGLTFLKGGNSLGSDEILLGREEIVLRTDEGSTPVEPSGLSGRGSSENIGASLSVRGVAIAVESGKVANDPSVNEAVRLSE